MCLRQNSHPHGHSSVHPASNLALVKTFSNQTNKGSELPGTSCAYEAETGLSHRGAFIPVLLAVWESSRTSTKICTMPTTSQLLILGGGTKITWGSRRKVMGAGDWPRPAICKAWGLQRANDIKRLGSSKGQEYAKGWGYSKASDMQRAGCLQRAGSSCFCSHIVNLPIIGSSLMGGWAAFPGEFPGPDQKVPSSIRVKQPRLTACD